MRRCNLALTAAKVVAAVAVVGMAGCVVVTDCTFADNYCSSPWDLHYCDVSTGDLLAADCNAACTSDPAVYGQVCGGVPAVAGQCDAQAGVCACFCEDAFDACLDPFTIRYTRGGITYEVDCRDYCGGFCDAAVAACACP